MRYQTATLTTSSVAPGEWLSINQPVDSSTINLVKIKVVPNEAGGTSRFQVYKRDTFLEADKLYDTREFTGLLIDPIEDYSDPMTDSPGATAERNEGSPIPYEDDDATSELHLRVYNGDVDAKTYTITVKYEQVLVPGGTGGELTLENLHLTGWLDVDGASTLNTLTASGLSTFAGVYVDGGLTIRAGGLAVTGNSTFYSAVNVTVGGSVFSDLTVTNLAATNNINVPAPGNATIATIYCSTIQASANGSAFADLTAAHLTLSPTSSATITNASGISWTVAGEGGSTSFIWDHVNSGWGWMLRTNAGINNHGLSIIADPSGANALLHVESISYPLTFQVRGDGKIVMGGANASGVLHVNGNQRPSEYTFLAEKTVANDMPTALFIGTQSGGALIECRYYTTTALNIHAASNATYIDMKSRAFGAGQGGGFINLGRNTSPASAGYINYVNQGGGNSCVWSDNTSTLRIAGNPPQTAGDTGGVIVGTQGSSRAIKQEIVPITPEETKAIASRIFHMPISRYKLKAEAAAGFDMEHLGFMADEQPQLLMYDGNSVDYLRVMMEIVVTLQELGQFAGYKPDPAGPPEKGRLLGRCEA